MRTVMRRPNPVFDDDYQVIRDVLLEARQGAGLSQRSLGERLGKAASHICMIETGQRRVDLLEFYRMARHLEVAPQELFSRLAERLAQLDAFTDVTERPVGLGGGASSDEQ